MKKLALLFAIILGLAFSANAQTLLVNTTLSGAASGPGSVNGATPTSPMGIVSVTSATGISAPSANTSLTSGLPATSEAQTFLFVDRELMQVKAISGTNITVIRGVGGTSATSHASGAIVLIVPSAAFGAWSGNGFAAAAQGPSVPQGSCLRTSELYLPRISFDSGTISDCLGGQWVNGDASQSTRQSFYRMTFPNTGAQSEGAVFGTNETLTQYQTYCTEIDLPYSRLLVGLAPHIGTTGGTDKWVVALYDSGGNLLTSSAAAGVTVGSAYAYQATAFSSPFYAVGPAQYFGCFTTNGDTATGDLITTAKGDNILTQTKSGSSFVVPTSITVPTAFTTLYGPYLYVY